MRCGHTRGKEVVGRDEAAARIRAAVKAREEGHDILIMARTDARYGHGLAEAIERCRIFADLGADILFLEAPQSEAEIAELCNSLPGPKVAKLVEQGDAPMLAPQKLGFKIVAYPLTLLSAALEAIRDTIEAMRQGTAPARLTSFESLPSVVVFAQYDRELAGLSPDRIES